LSYARAAPYVERHLSAQDGLRLYYRDYGDPLSARLPVVCLPGLTRNSHDFEPFAVRLAGERRLLSPDYRGRGLSAWDPDWRNYQGLVYLNDVLHLLAATGTERCIVVGTSLGGILAMGLCALRPSVVAGLVLNDIGPDVAEAGVDRITHWVSEDKPQPDWATAEKFIRVALGHLPIKDDAAWRNLARGTFRERADGMLHFDYDTALVKGLRKDRTSVPDLWPLFRATVAVPTLLLRGEASDVLTEKGVAAMVSARPDLLHVTVRDAGHVPSLVEPESRQALDDFLARF
jgi:pimeloyl-ACP methyl ester carboxylesterase